MATGGGDLNDRFEEQYWLAVEKLIAKGLDENEAPVKAYEIVREAMSDGAPGLAEALVDTGRDYMARYAIYRQGFAERLRAHWGEPLDLYENFVAIIEGASSQFGGRNARQNGEFDLLIEVLLELNGQAIRIAREVHALLSAGFPLGGLALSRSIHEISVRAMVLSDFGVLDKHKGLAEKFAVHAHVANYGDALTYQRDAEELGYEPLDDDDLAEMEKLRDSLVDKYGKAFKSPFGWASGLPGLPGEPSFERLEAVAQLGHHRGLYKWSSHLVHGDSTARGLSRIERGGREAVLTNATNNRLADPAQHALLSLYRTFVAMVTAVAPVAFYDEFLCMALRNLLEDIDHALVDAEREVDEAEERLQAELAERGLRFDPVLGEVPISEE